MGVKDRFFGFFSPSQRKKPLTSFDFSLRHTLTLTHTHTLSLSHTHTPSTHTHRPPPPQLVLYTHTHTHAQNKTNRKTFATFTWREKTTYECRVSVISHTDTYLKDLNKWCEPECARMCMCVCVCVCVCFLETLLMWSVSHFAGR